MTQVKSPEKRESMLANLALNILIPTLILMKMSENAWFASQLVNLDGLLGSALAPSYNEFGTRWAIIVALAFPIIYGINDFRRAKKVNLFSALGVISIMLTGGISLLELDPKYIAIKEAAIPGLIGLATLFSIKTRYPDVKTLLYNDKILQVERIAEALESRKTASDFEHTLKKASWIIAGSFFLSSVLNYALAKYLLVSPPGTAEFNAELGKMTALSFPVIALPATIVLMGALYYLFKSITKLTNLSLDDILVEQ
jgi:hypothetical protein